MDDTNRGPAAADSQARSVAEQLALRDRVGMALGIELVEVRAGFARLRMTVRDDMLNGLDILHGGVVFSLADTALAYAANSRDSEAVTYQASIVFLNQAAEGDTLVAEARERTFAGRSGVYEVAVTAGTGKPLAHFSGLTRLTRLRS